MATILIPLLICIVGLLVYVLAGNPGNPPSSVGGKVAELGRIAFFCGLFWVVYITLGHAVHF
jgi:hypothetical protein